jgi:hypothetical protein
MADLMVAKRTVGLMAVKRMVDLTVAEHLTVEHRMVAERLTAADTGNG